MRYQLGKGILALVLLMGQCSPAAANESVPLQILQVRLHTSQGEWHNSEWSDEAVTVTVRANASAVRLGCTREGTLPQRWDDELTLTEGGDWYLFARDELGRISEPFLLSDLMIDLEAPAYDMDHLIVETDWKAQTGSFRRDLEQDERSGIVKVRMHRGDARWQEVGEETLYFQGNEIITFQAEDQAGNVSEQELQLISVDEQAPDIHVTLAQPKLSASAQTVEIDLQEEYLKMAEAVLEKDGQTETFSLKQGMTTLSVSEEGEYRLKVKAFDQAGNVSEQEHCFAIDVSAPSIFVSQTKDELLPGPARLQIKVREPHFIASGASLTGSYAQQELEWKEKDGWHVAELCVKEEGIHAGSLLIHDAAGKCRNMRLAFAGHRHPGSGYRADDDNGDAGARHGGTSGSGQHPADAYRQPPKDQSAAAAGKPGERENCFCIRTRCVCRMIAIRCGCPCRIKREIAVSRRSLFK